MSERYRLRTPTVGLQTKDGKTNPFVIPTGAILTITNSPVEQDRGSTVDCVWNGTVVQLLAFDLRERGTRVESKSRSTQT